jgi:hypothetical protein
MVPAPAPANVEFYNISIIRTHFYSEGGGGSLTKTFALGFFVVVSELLI